MLLWIKDNIGTIIVSLIVLTVITLIIVRLIKRKRAGKCVACECCDKCNRACSSLNNQLLAQSSQLPKEGN